MSTDVIVAIIAGCCTIIGVVITSLVTARKTNSDVISKLDKSQSIMEQKIEDLTKEVARHNEFASRVPVIENRVQTLEREISEVKKEVKDK